jgi:hypothetical protein
MMVTLQVLFLVPVVSFCQSKGDGKITIAIQPVFNNRPLVLEDENYVNTYGDTLTISTFKFYLTQIELKGTNGKQFKCGNCAHLFNTEETSSALYSINAPENEYSQISFILGVDSATNTTGAHGGALDPAKGMYWAWNTGYIMAKLEGNSKACKTLHNAFEYHVGGYMPPHNTARTVTLTLPHPVAIKKDGNVTIKLKADAAAWFENIGLSKMNKIVIPGKDASMMADNYAKMFSISTD